MARSLVNVLLAINIFIQCICFNQFRYLAPSFLASVGALGYVGYAIAQTKPIPQSSNASILHLIGFAGGFGISIWMTAVHGWERTIT